MCGLEGEVKISGICVKIFFRESFFCDFLKIQQIENCFSIGNNIHSRGDKMVVLENKFTICGIQKNINNMSPKAANFCNRITIIWFKNDVLLK